jgi:hypothetical protein
MILMYMIRHLLVSIAKWTLLDVHKFPQFPAWRQPSDIDLIIQRNILTPCSSPQR